MTTLLADFSAKLQQRCFQINN